VSVADRRPQRQHWWWWALMGVVVVVAVVTAGSGTPSQGVSQERLFALSARLKCLQCVGESVAASQAPLAVKFRDEIDDQMRRGRTDDEILNFFAQRYGQEVLLTPPATGLGGLVWVIPVVAGAGAVLGLVGVFRRWRREQESTHATDEDRAIVDAALSGRGARRRS
jgi:cytochrome c-type biogenesis protein CcmH